MLFSFEEQSSFWFKGKFSPTVSVKIKEAKVEKASYGSSQLKKRFELQEKCSGEDSVKVNKVLMWMGPEACVKHEQHPFPPGDKEKLKPLWSFFDNLCSKKEGCHGSWNAARMTLKFMRQEKGESVDIFYGRIRDVLHQCEYDPEMQKVLEAETLKYGRTNSKIIEKAMLYPKRQMQTVFLRLPSSDAHMRSGKNQKGPQPGRN